MNFVSPADPLAPILDPALAMTTLSSLTETMRRLYGPAYASRVKERPDGCTVFTTFCGYPCRAHYRVNGGVFSTEMAFKMPREDWVVGGIMLSLELDNRMYDFERGGDYTIFVKHGVVATLHHKPHKAPWLLLVYGDHPLIA